MIGFALPILFHLNFKQKYLLRQISRLSSFCFCFFNFYLFALCSFIFLLLESSSSTNLCVLVHWLLMLLILLNNFISPGDILAEIIHLVGKDNLDNPDIVRCLWDVQFPGALLYENSCDAFHGQWA